MITLLSRADALAQHPVLAHSIRQVQAAHDPGRDDTWPADAEALAWFAAFRDEIPERDVPPWAESLILQLSADSLDGLVSALPGAMARLLEALGQHSLTLLHLSRAARWPTRRRSPQQLADAGRSFRGVGARGGFNGGIVVDRDSLADVLVPLFWTVRMDGSYGEPFFAVGDAPVVGSVCKYGNVHLDVYGSGWPERARASAEAAGFEVLPNMCDERFGTGGKIEGRRIRV